jgi:hypothetical protein
LLNLCSYLFNPGYQVIVIGCVDFVTEVTFVPGNVVLISGSRARKGPIDLDPLELVILDDFGYLLCESVLLIGFDKARELVHKF